MNAVRRQVAADLWTKPIGLNHKPACRLPVNYTHHRHFIITQPESWYSFYHPTEGKRLSRPLSPSDFGKTLKNRRWSHAKLCIATPYSGYVVLLSWLSLVVLNDKIMVLFPGLGFWAQVLTMLTMCWQRVDNGTSVPLTTRLLKRSDLNAVVCFSLRQWNTLCMKLSETNSVEVSVCVSVCVSVRLCTSVYALVTGPASEHSELVTACTVGVSSAQPDESDCTKRPGTLLHVSVQDL